MKARNFSTQRILINWLLMMSMWQDFGFIPSSFLVTGWRTLLTWWSTLSNGGNSSESGRSPRRFLTILSKKEVLYTLITETGRGSKFLYFASGNMWRIRRTCRKWKSSLSTCWTDWRRRRMGKKSPSFLTAKMQGFQILTLRSSDLSSKFWLVTILTL